VLANNLVDPWTLALSGSDVYFLDLGLSATSGTLQEVPEVGGAAKILLNNLPSPWAIVSDNGSLYFVDETGPMIGSINALNVVNGSVKNLAFDLISPVAVAVDSKNVYWTDFDCGTVMKTSK
jgi:hypothetical protein